MANNMTMKKVNIFEIKAKLSEYLDLVEKGEQVVICRRNQPVAELRSVVARPTTERPLGGTQLDIPDTFFEPLPSDFEDAFYGPWIGGSASTAAERAEKPYRAGQGVTRRKKS